MIVYNFSQELFRLVEVIINQFKHKINDQIIRFKIKSRNYQGPQEIEFLFKHSPDYKYLFDQI